MRAAVCSVRPHDQSNTVTVVSTSSSICQKTTLTPIFLKVYQIQGPWSRLGNQSETDFRSSPCPVFGNNKLTFKLNDTWIQCYIWIFFVLEIFE